MTVYLSWILGKGRKDSVIKEAKGVGAISLIRTARTQILTARDYEAKGDLRSALATYIRAATLTKMAMDSQEYSQENRGKGGVIRKELNDFLEVSSHPQLSGLDLYIRQSEGRDITQRTNAIEDKLKAIEITQSRYVPSL
jgi:ubiquitin carboxyl-terminal hydrolase 8